MFDNKYPYTDFHELNLDWFLAKFKELVEEWATVQADWTSLHDYVQNYFDNLNVQTEIDNKINAMILNGTFADIVSPFVTAALPALVAGQLPDVVAAQISSVVAAQISAVVADQLPAVAAQAAAYEVGAWLDAHIDPDTGYVIDDTLTVSQAAADAKTTGDYLIPLSYTTNANVITGYNCDGRVGEAISITENATFKYCKIENVKYAYKYIAYTRTLSNITVPYAYLCDSNDIILKVFYATEASANTSIDILTDDPAAVTLYIRSATNNCGAIYQVSAEAALNKANNAEKIIGPVEFTTNYGETCDGNVGDIISVVSDSYWNYTVINVSIDFTYTVTFHALSSSDVYYIFLCNSDGTIIDKISEDTTASDNTKTVIIDNPDIKKMYIRTYRPDYTLAIDKCIAMTGTLSLMSRNDNILGSDIEDNSFMISYEYDQAVSEFGNVIDILGVSSFKNRKLTTVNPYCYTAWPLLGKINDVIYCIYTVQDQHVQTDHVYHEGYYYRTSKDGIIWSAEKPLYENVEFWGGPTGIGNNSDGDLLIWCRKSTTPRFALYKMSSAGIEKITELPNSTPNQHIGDIFSVDSKLMCFYNTYGSSRSWGIYTSTDDGETWLQSPIETNLSVDECPVEICGVYLGNNKILAMGRKDSNSGTVAMFQITSTDSGTTWSKEYTNITDISGSTPALIYDSLTDKLYLYYFQRGAGNLRERVNTSASIWNTPTSWNNSEIIATGTTSTNDNGNVKALKVKDYQLATFYAGTTYLTGIYSVLRDY